MPKQKKKLSKKELTPSEKLQKLIKEGKVLSRPILEGNSDADEAKTLIKRQQIVDGHLSIGLANGITFSSDLESRSSDWFRYDVFITVQAKPESVDEVHSVLEDYLVDKLADYVDRITGE